MVNKSMAVYTPFRKLDFLKPRDERLGLERVTYIIESVEIKRRLFNYPEAALVLHLRGNTDVGTYCLIGKEVYRPFLQDMGVEHARDLVSRTIVGHASKANGLRGIEPLIQ
jgi:hypothetical protein